MEFLSKITIPQKNGSGKQTNFFQFLKIYLPYTLLQKDTGRCISPKLKKKKKKKKKNYENPEKHKENKKIHKIPLLTDNHR